MRAQQHFSDRGFVATARDGLAAGAIAAVLSGAPSTIHALATGRDPFEATAAAGSVAVGSNASQPALIAAAVPVHIGISLAWGVALAFALPQKRTLLWGALAGLGIAAVDLGLIGPRYPLIANLEKRPQIADHIAFGAIVGVIVARRRSRIH